MEDINKIYAQITIDELKEIYKGASKERKEELLEEFLYLETDIRKRVKTYEDALRVLGKKDFNRENLYPREIARRKLEIIIEALNEGWKPNFNSIKQSKWYCAYDRSYAGLGYSYSSYSPTFTYLGVRLCLKSKELADYIGSNFKNLYEIMLLG